MLRVESSGEWIAKEPWAARRSHERSGEKNNLWTCRDWRSQWGKKEKVSSRCLLFMKTHAQQQISICDCCNCLRGFKLALLTMLEVWYGMLTAHLLHSEWCIINQEMLEATASRGLKMFSHKQNTEHFFFTMPVEFLAPSNQYNLITEAYGRKALKVS